MAYREQYTQELDMNDTEDISDTIKYETISAKLLEKGKYYVRCMLDSLDFE